MSFDIDSLERPPRPERFLVTVGGRDYRLVDILDLDHREVTSALTARVAGDSHPLVRCVVSEADREAFFANSLPAWKLNRLFDAYLEHYRRAQED